MDRAAADPPRRSSRAIQLLDFDPELGAGLSADARGNARSSAWALAFEVRLGRWDPASVPALHGEGTGALVLEGLLLHEIALGNRRGAELIGAGDLIYPLDPERVASFDEEGDWYGLEPALLAIVDRGLIARAGRFPPLAAALAARSGSHHRHLALQTLCTRSRRVDDRLIVLFAVLAERWGRVCPDGIRIPLPLPHRVLAQLVAAQRPSVTTALTRLRRRRLVEQLGPGGWLLCGQRDLNGFVANLATDRRWDATVVARLPEPRAGRLAAAAAMAHA